MATKSKSRIWLFVAAAFALLAGGTVTLIQALGAGANKKLFSTTLFGVVSRQLPNLSVAGRVLMVAQAAHESGWGQLGQSRTQSNNLWNITAGSSWTGPVVAGTDTDKGQPIAQRWRVYSSLEAAVTDYWQFLGTLYPAARAELEGDANPVAFAEALTHCTGCRGGVGSYYDATTKTSYTSSLSSIRATVANALAVNA